MLLSPQSRLMLQHFKSCLVNVSLHSSWSQSLWAPCSRQFCNWLLSASFPLDSPIPEELLDKQRWELSEGSCQRPGCLPVPTLAAKGWHLAGESHSHSLMPGAGMILESCPRTWLLPMPTPSVSLVALSIGSPALQELQFPSPCKAPGQAPGEPKPCQQQQLGVSAGLWVLGWRCHGC